MHSSPGPRPPAPTTQQISDKPKVMGMICIDIL